MLTVVKGTTNCTNSKLLTKGKNTLYNNICSLYRAMKCSSQ